MKVALELYGGLREAIDDSTLELSTGTTIGEAIETLQSRFPGTAELLARSVVAISEEVVDSQRIIAEQEILHILPPFSGG